MEINNSMTISQRLAEVGQLSASKLEAVKNSLGEANAAAMGGAEQWGVLIDKNIQKLGDGLRKELNNTREELMVLHAQHEAALKRQAILQWCITAAIIAVVFIKEVYLK